MSFTPTTYPGIVVRKEPRNTSSLAHYVLSTFSSLGAKIFGPLLDSIDDEKPNDTGSVWVPSQCGLERFMSVPGYNIHTSNKTEDEPETYLTISQEKDCLIYRRHTKPFRTTNAYSSLYNFLFTLTEKGGRIYGPFLNRLLESSTLDKRILIWMPKGQYADDSTHPMATAEFVLERTSTRPSRYLSCHNEGRCLYSLCLHTPSTPSVTPSPVLPQEDPISLLSNTLRMCMSASPEKVTNLKVQAQKQLDDILSTLPTSSPSVITPSDPMYDVASIMVEFCREKGLIYGLDKDKGLRSDTTHLDVSMPSLRSYQNVWNLLNPNKNAHITDNDNGICYHKGNIEVYFNVVIKDYASTSQGAIFTLADKSNIVISHL
jgi:hypothetical protein